MVSQNELKTGTTTVGIVVKDAVILAADMQATLGHLSYDQESQKIYKVTDKTALTTAGSVADSMTLLRFLQAHAKLYEIERDTPMTAKAMATYISNVLNANRYFPFEVQFILAGMIRKPELFELMPFGGYLERSQFATSGSGTTLALTVLDQNYKDNMNLDDGLHLVTRAILASKKRDIYTGGRSITIMVIDTNGARLLDDEAIKKLVEEEKNRTIN
ncbi:MAG: proteasome subunit beta [Candidatus Diapherotrites archaeon]|nr:proteasome subunit beta [Candidatus Diapherotrites archaeon]